MALNLPILNAALGEGMSLVIVGEVIKLINYDRVIYEKNLDEANQWEIKRIIEAHKK